MQADEIIQQKEWAQLTIEEKKSIQELAATEQEYNLVKKMLQVSAEEAVDIPVAGNHIKDNLLRAVTARKKNGSVKMYWYAAAAIMVLVLGILFFYQKDPAPDKYAEKSNKESTIPDQPKIVKTETSVAKDSLPVVAKNIIPSKNIAVTKKTPPAKNMIRDNGNVQPQQQVYAVVNTSISAEKELLEFVTEMY